MSTTTDLDIEGTNETGDPRIAGYDLTEDANVPVACCAECTPHRERNAPLRRWTTWAADSALCERCGIGLPLVLTDRHGEAREMPASVSRLLEPGDRVTCVDGEFAGEEGTMGRRGHHVRAMVRWGGPRSTRGAVSVLVSTLRPVPRDD